MTVINKLEITSFGKFQNFEMRFSGGFEEFVLDNEFGKSTLTDFIIFILYGLKYTVAKSTVLEDYPLKKYMPWNDEALLSGAMEVTADGRALRIERTQRLAKNSRVVMRDADGGEIPLTGTPGQMLFGVDEETFERTFLVRQTQIRFSSTAGLATAVKNLVTTGDESTSFAAAQKKLADKRKAYRHSKQQGGRIFDIPKELTALDLEYAEGKRKSETFAAQTAEYDRLQAEWDACAAKEQAYQAQLLQARGGDARRTLSKLEALETQIESLRAQETEAPEEAELEQIKAAFATKEQAEITRRLAADALAAAENSERALREQYPLYDLLRQNESEVESLCRQKDRYRIPFAIAGAVLVLAGVAAAFWNTATGVISAAAGGVLLLLGALFKQKVKIPATYGMTQAELQEAYAVYQREKFKIELCKNEKERQTAAVAAAEERCASAAAACKPYEERYRLHNTSDAERLAQAGADARHRHGMIAQLESQRETLLQNTDRATLEQTAALGDSERTETEVQQLLIEQITRKNRLAQRLQEGVLLRQKRAEAGARMVAIEERRRALRQELEEATYRDSVLGAAYDALEQAYQTISNRVAPVITERAGVPLSRLTDGKYDSVRLDQQFNIRVKSGNEYYPLGYFSRGTADAVYFAVRYAVSDLISGNAGLPMVLDDAFWSLDNDRLKNARAFCRQSGNDRQIILFSARK